MGTKIKIECYCGNVVFRRKIPTRPQKYCSRKCYLSSDEYSLLQREKMLKRSLVGSKNPNWKGEEVSYAGIHKWVGEQKGSAAEYVCEMCNGESGSNTMEWANMDMKYTRDLSTWKPLCKICHSKYDQEKFKVYGHQMSEEGKRRLSDYRIISAKCNFLSELDIVCIFLKHGTQRELAEKYSISPESIRRIQNGELRKDVVSKIIN